MHNHIYLILKAHHSTKIPEQSPIEPHNVTTILNNLFTPKVRQMDTFIQADFLKKNPPENSLVFIISDATLLKKFRETKIKFSKDELNMIDTMIVRVSRFRMKLYYVTTLAAQAPRRNLVVSHKLKDIWDTLCRTRILLNLNSSPHGLKITVPMTVALLKRKLTPLETMTKGLLNAIASLYDIPDHTRRDFWSYPSIFAAYNEVAPEELTGWEADYFYVFSLIKNPDTARKIFNPIQHKQCCMFCDEILDLMVFFRYGVVDNTAFSELLDKKCVVMNIPYSKCIIPNFPQNPKYKPPMPALPPVLVVSQISMPPLPPPLPPVFAISEMDNAVFSKFVTACSNTVIELYYIMFKHVITTISIENKNKPE